MKFKDFAEEEKLFVRRALISFGFVLLCFSALVINLYHLQIEQNHYYQTRSNANDIKMIPIAPTRGIIFDRNGIPLVKNVTRYDIEVLPYKIKDINALVAELTPVVDLTQDDIDTFERALHESSRYKPVILKTELTDEQVARFSVGQYNYPGVNINSYEDRQYPYGPDLAHVIGYVSKINDRDYDRLNAAGLAENYAADHNIGKQGIEGYYESVLHGKTGYQEVEVDNRGG